MKTLKDFNFENKRVLVRCDFNVPLDKQGNILDDFRIKISLPTIKYLIKKKAKIILLSHLGQPQGEVKKNLKLTIIKDRLEKYLNCSSIKIKNCLDKDTKNLTKKIKTGDILLLENLRFYKEELKNNQDFAKKLAELGDIYINNAFSVCHRTEASVVSLPKYLPSGAGFLLENEIKILSKIIKNFKRPLVVIIAGSKIKSKTEVAESFFKIADFLLLGNLISESFKRKKIKSLEKILFSLNSERNCDIGPKTIKAFQKKISLAKTIFWAGPLGKIEEKEYQKGTKEIAQAIIKSRAFSVIGGGNTIEFLNKIGLIKKFNYVSMGGGAMLTFLSGEKLPGLEALKYVS